MTTTSLPVRHLLAHSTKHSSRLWFWPVVSMWKHDVSTKREVRNILRYLQGRTEPPPCRSHVRELWYAVFSKRQRITLRLLYAIGRPSVVCLSSVVCDVGAPYSGGYTFRQFFSPYDSPRTLLFWCQKSLVGDAPFPLKFAFKVTHPLSNSEILTNIGS